MKPIHLVPLVLTATTCALYDRYGIGECAGQDVAWHWTRNYFLMSAVLSPLTLRRRK